MRWPAEKEPEVGDVRYVSRFLFLPKTLPLWGDTKLQTRWLEFAEVRQVLSSSKSLPYWRNDSWGSE